MIICAAIKIQVEGLDHETIIPCHRHRDGFKMLKDLGFKPRVGYKEIAQGFITNEGEFLDRRQALIHALQYGQVSPAAEFLIQKKGLSELYSEDLY